jgi:hypothetical protein
MKNIFILFFLLATMEAVSQTTISGTVADERGEKIPGANVSLEGFYDGTSSAVDGSFSFTTQERGVANLVVSFVGYQRLVQAVRLEKKPIVLALVLREEISQLDAVTISAGSFTAGEEKRRTILKAVDIATTAGATADIAGALNTLPGTTKNGESGRLFVRGGDSNETRTFIDGMAVYNAYGPSAPNTPGRGRFMPFMFKGTSFSTGGYSAEYGQALSSALVLNSKDKAELNQTDIGLLSVGADVAHTQVWDRSSITGKVQYTNVRPYFGLIDQRVDWINMPASIEGSAAYRTEVGKDGLLKLYSNFNHSNFTLRNHDVADPTLAQTIELSNSYGYGNAAYRQSIGTDWVLRGGLSYNYNLNDYRVDDVPLQEKEQGVHAKAVAEHSISDRVEVRFGSEMIQRNYSANKQDEKTAALLTQGFDETISGSFVEVEAYANKHLVAKPGVRAEFNMLTGRWQIDPRVSLAYRPRKNGQFSFAYGTFHQSVQNQYLRVNNALGAERAEHFILNYQLMSNNRTFRIETYYKKYDQLVRFVNGDAMQLNNTGFGYAKGVELFWRDNQTLKNVDYWISYSYLDTERDYLNYTRSAMPSFAATHNFSFVYKHFITAIRSQVGFTYSYSTGRPYYNPNNLLFNGDRTPYYEDLSLNVSYLPKNWLIIYASCTNLTGRDNIFGYTYSATPDAGGVYASRAVRQPAPHFIFLGVFITLSKNKGVNQLPNL